MYPELVRPRQASEPRNLCRQRFFEDESFFNPKAGLEGRLAAAEDVMDSSQRLQLRFATQQVVLQTMADLEVNTAACTRLCSLGWAFSHRRCCAQLDAFVAPTNNQSAPRLDAPRPLGRHARPDTWSFLGAQGIPHLTVPAGFTTDVWDRIRDPSVDPATLHDLSPADEDSERRRRAETRPNEGCERSAFLFRDAGLLPASSARYARFFSSTQDTC